MWSAYFFDQGKGNRVQGVTGALWAAYNCVVEYVDHRASEQQTPERRLNSVWFGDGYLAQGAGVSGRGVAGGDVEQLISANGKPGSPVRWDFIDGVLAVGTEDRSSCAAAFSGE